MIRLLARSVRSAVLHPGHAVLLVALLVACTSEREVPENIVLGVNFVGMVVSDLDASSALYQRAADLAPVADDAPDFEQLLIALSGGSVAAVDTRMLVGINAQLRLMAFQADGDMPDSPPVPVNGPGIAHVCYQVAASTQAYQRFLDGGASSIGAREMVTLNARNPVQYAYAHDPDGILIEVEHVDVDRLEASRRPPHRYRVRHVSLATPDMDRAVAFYAQLLAQPEPRRIGNWFGIGGDKFDQVSGLRDTRIEMAWFQTRNLELEIVEYRSHPPQVPASSRSLSALGYNMIVFEVADISSARARVLAAGGEVLGDPRPLDGGEVLFARDPDGNLLGFQRLPATALASSRNFEGNGT